MQRNTYRAPRKRVGTESKGIRLVLTLTPAFPISCHKLNPTKNVNKSCHKNFPQQDILVKIPPAVTRCIIVLQLENYAFSASYWDFAAKFLIFILIGTSKTKDKLAVNKSRCPAVYSFTLQSFRLFMTAGVLLITKKCHIKFLVFHLLWKFDEVKIVTVREKDNRILSKETFQQIIKICVTNILPWNFVDIMLHTLLCGTLV